MILVELEVYENLIAKEDELKGVDAKDADKVALYKE